MQDPHNLPNPTEIFTSNFLLHKPVLGSYFGSWNVPVNANMDLIDSILQTLKTNSIAEVVPPTIEGSLWYDPAVHFLFLNTNVDRVKLITDADIILTVDEQHELNSGHLSVSDLHSHPGHSTQFFRVMDPALASTTDELNNKPYFAVPYQLFANEASSSAGDRSNLRAIVMAEKAKLNGISTNGIDIHIGSSTASGESSAVSFTAQAGTSGGTIKIGGGTAPGTTEIVVTTSNPINFKSTSGPGLGLQVDGSTVWMESNQGTGSGMDSDMVDGRNVDDTHTTTSNLWTAKKTSDMIAAVEEVPKANTLGDPGGPFHDTAYFATEQEMVDHKASGDHDERYPLRSEMFNVPIGGIIIFNPGMVVGGMGNFDGDGQGTGPLTGFQICNGVKNGAPDLRGLFVLGSGPDAAIVPGTHGGEAEHQLTVNEMPKHTHTYTRAGSQGWDTTAGQKSPGNVLAAYPDSVSSITGADNVHNNMPPYIAMIYIARYK